MRRVCRFLTLAVLATVVMGSAATHDASASRAWSPLSAVPTDTTVAEGTTAGASAANQRALGSDPTLLLLVLTAMAAVGVAAWFVSSRRPVRSTSREPIDP